MSDFEFNNIRGEYRDQNNLNPLTLIVGDAQGNIPDPDVPGNVLVRYSQSGVLSMPFSVGAPTSKMNLKPGQAVELSLNRFGDQYISGYDNQAAVAQGDTPLANVLDTKKTKQQNLATLLPQPTQPASTVVNVKGWKPTVNYVGYNFPGGTLDLGVAGANVIPGAGDQAWIMIAIDNDYATLVAYSSTVVSLFDVIDYDESRQECLDQLNAGATPIWSLLLSDDQSSIEQADFDNGEDERDTVNAAESGGGSGDVTGPGSSVIGDIAIWDDTLGTEIDDSGVSISADGTFAANSDALVPTQKAVKSYVDNAIDGLSPKEDLAVWTATALPAVTYSNGASGVGATLTGVSTGVLTIDGVAVTAGMRIGVKDQVTQLQNGIYECTVAGAIGVAFILTRTHDANTSNELLGAYAFALQGTANADTAFLCANTSAITIGTDAITFVRFQGAGINQLTGGATAGPGIGSQVATLPAKFLIQTADANLPNAQALSALATGLAKVTTTTGVVSSVTDSAGLAACLSDETGTGAAVFANTPTLTTPTIADFTNAQHDHTDADDGGTLDVAAITSGILSEARGGTARSTGAATKALDNLASVAVNTSLISDTDITDDLGSAAKRWLNIFGQNSEGDAWGMRVRNGSGATANANEIGYLDYDATYGTVYKTTTTANYVNVGQICAVLVGAADGADIYVAQRGQVTIKYTGTAPSAGHFLSTSTVAGQCQRNTLMRPEVFAVATAAGSGGLVTATLLTQTMLIPFSTTSNIISVATSSTTVWTGTINGTPSATSVVVTTSTGNVNCFTPNGTLLGNFRLWNTTRNTYRLVSSISGSTITTVSTSDAWASTDALTIESQTTTTGAANKMAEIDLSESIPSTIPNLARALSLLISTSDTSTTVASTNAVHPYETFAGSKQLVTFSIPAAAATPGRLTGAVNLIGGVICMSCVATGTGTANPFLRLFGYYLAIP